MTQFQDQKRKAEEKKALQSAMSRAKRRPPQGDRTDAGGRNDDHEPVAATASDEPSSATAADDQGEGNQASAMAASDQDEGDEVSVNAASDQDEDGNGAGVDYEGDDDVSDELAAAVEQYVADLANGSRTTEHAQGRAQLDPASGQPWERVQAILQAPVDADEAAVARLRKIKQDAREKFGLQTVDLTPLFQTGADKPHLDDAHQLLLDDAGTTTGKRRWQSCPTPGCKFVINDRTAAQTISYHIPGCVQKAVSTYLYEEYSKLLKPDKCPIYRCTSKSMKADRCFGTHFSEYHPNSRLRCGLTKADGTECLFSVTKDPNQHADSFDFALLEQHREHCHAWPARALQSCIFDPDGQFWIIGHTEIMVACAAQCPANGETLLSTQVRWTPDHCPFCFQDEDLCPRLRVFAKPDMHKHLWPAHLLRHPQDHESSFICCPCCHEVVRIWELPEHLHAAGIPVLRSQVRGAGKQVKQVDEEVESVVESSDDEEAAEPGRQRVGEVKRDFVEELKPLRKDDKRAFEDWKEWAKSERASCDSDKADSEATTALTGYAPYLSILPAEVNEGTTGSSRSRTRGASGTPLSQRPKYVRKPSTTPRKRRSSAQKEASSTTTRGSKKATTTKAASSKKASSAKAAGNKKSTSSTAGASSEDASSSKTVSNKKATTSKAASSKKSATSTSVDSDTTSSAKGSGSKKPATSRAAAAKKAPPSRDAGPKATTSTNEQTSVAQLSTQPESSKRKRVTSTKARRGVAKKAQETESESEDVTSSEESSDSDDEAGVAGSSTYPSAPTRSSARQAASGQTVLVESEDDEKETESEWEGEASRRRSSARRAGRS